MSVVVLNHSGGESEKPLEVPLERCALLIWSRPAFKVPKECYACALATLAYFNEGNHLRP